MDFRLYVNDDDAHIWLLQPLCNKQQASPARGARVVQKFDRQQGSAVCVCNTHIVCTTQQSSDNLVKNGWLLKPGLPIITPTLGIWLDGRECHPLHARDEIP
jgi:hypothetical protein